MSEYQITQDQIDAMLEKLASYADMYDDEVSVRANYSGRGMYGASCVGFVASSASLPAIAVALFQTIEAEYGEADAWHLVQSSREDSMGRSQIIYFEELTLDGDPDEEDD